MANRMIRAMALLFAVGSTLFALGSVPPYFNAVGAKTTAITFFTGSIFFTTAAYLQYRLAINEARVGPRVFRFGRPSPVIAASGIQLIGTVFFNISTFVAIDAALTVGQADRLVWAPDALGSIAFLASSLIALGAISHNIRAGSGRRGRQWWVAVVNVVGSLAFGLSALGAFVLPQTGEMVNVTVVNAATFAGAVAFLIGALLTVPTAEPG